MKAADYAGFGKRKADAEKRGKLRGIGMACYIEACGIAPSPAVGSLGAGVGLWESAEVRVNPIGTIEVLTGAHSPRPGPRDELRADRLRTLRSADREHLDRARRHRQGAVRHGHLRVAHRRSRMSAIVKALDKVEAKVKKIAAHLMEASEGDIEISNGEVKVAGTDKKLPWHRSALPPIRRTTCRQAWSRA